MFHCKSINSISYFDSFLHKQHCNKQAKQFPCNTSEPIDNGGSS